MKLEENKAKGRKVLDHKKEYTTLGQIQLNSDKLLTLTLITIKIINIHNFLQRKYKN